MFMSGILLMTVNKDGEDLELGEYSYTYANDYVFGEDFSDWFERSLKNSHIPLLNIQRIKNPNALSNIMKKYKAK